LILTLTKRGMGCTVNSAPSVSPIIEPGYFRFHGMALSTPQYSRTQVDQAGRKLVASPQYDRDHYLTVINNWRSSHSYPLQALKMTLLGRAKGVDSKARPSDGTSTSTSHPPLVVFSIYHLLHHLQHHKPRYHPSGDPV